MSSDATIGEAFTGTSDDGRWVTANIYPAGGGDRLASAAEWVFVSDALTTSSSSAAEYSEGLAEGRDLGVSPRARPEGLIECVTAALRAQNGG
ncbi:hypothetical protein [Iamia sp.]|uniref:hypothetical protein n=1 Tax=Iamia sp. TaxID=2722710 RepID=UPI002C3930DA|nr:hypothetical protein [Iamia sp.]HXH58910.1 hypothetical protein [Iamia sp.]